MYQFSNQRCKQYEQNSLQLCYYNAENNILSEPPQLSIVNNESHKEVDVSCIITVYRS